MKCARKHYCPTQLSLWLTFQQGLASNILFIYAKKKGTKAININSYMYFNTGDYVVDSKRPGTYLNVTTFQRQAKPSFLIFHKM